jgi:hypothetical protein
MGFFAVLLSSMRRLHNEELHNLFANMEPKRNAYKILVGKLEGRYHSEDLGIDGKILLERILEK